MVVTFFLFEVIHGSLLTNWINSCKELFLSKSLKTIFRDVSIEKVVNENEDVVLHYCMNNITPNEKVKGDDFVVLASSRDALKYV